MFTIFISWYFKVNCSVLTAMRVDDYCALAALPLKQNLLTSVPGTLNTSYRFYLFFRKIGNILLSCFFLLFSLHLDKALSTSS